MKFFTHPAGIIITLVIVIVAAYYIGNSQWLKNLLTSKPTPPVDGTACTDASGNKGTFKAGVCVATNQGGGPANPPTSNRQATLPITCNQLQNQLRQTEIDLNIAIQQGNSNLIETYQSAIKLIEAQLTKAGCAGRTQTLPPTLTVPRGAVGCQKTYPYGGVLYQFMYAMGKYCYYKRP